MIDPDFAKNQLILLTREWYMHPNGQIPAYEWAFGDVNPPVHAWAAMRVYQIEEKLYGRTDREFLERIFQKLLINFTWWVNRKDAEGNNIFEGGFLGLDNISVFDRTSGLPIGRLPRAGRRHELDGDVLPQPSRHRAGARQEGLRSTRTSPPSSSSTSCTSARRSTTPAATARACGTSEDGFYYDVLRLPDGRAVPDPRADDLRPHPDLRGRGCRP